MGMQDYLRGSFPWCLCCRSFLALSQERRVCRPTRQKHKPSDANDEGSNDSKISDDLELHASETNQPRQNNIPRSNKQKRVGWPRGSSDVKVSHPLIAACCAIPQDQDSKSKADGSTKTKSYKSIYYRYVAVYLQNMTYLPVQPYETAGTDYTSLLVIPFPCSCQNWLQIERKLQNPQYHMTAFVAQQKAGTSDLQAVPEPANNDLCSPRLVVDDRQQLPSREQEPLSFEAVHCR
ncbi:hypothetical protein ASPVEDRAFT_46303 [Aspergillus versicolor CBS 583.65]|uniref:Uncharacterized protein n=1 Tax=Aspergillus versicolor CBS 583.65 TaxID=1036611 RepID=A0A1L9PZI8_ASPVE|nr:uncharacterized protein ASPVEDRAFT_46303 [Aspergillus versicolor CBS 583.65]OJJ06937.1 hypothetical protein ASPVEDRAFT_46303 [Aspergillus versicolor CBS 583.65]